jgi:hypothetical protein
VKFPQTHLTAMYLVGGDGRLCSWLCWCRCRWVMVDLGVVEVVAVVVAVMAVVMVVVVVAVVAAAAVVAAVVVVVTAVNVINVCVCVCLSGGEGGGGGARAPQNTHLTPLITAGLISSTRAAGPPSHHLALVSNLEKTGLPPHRTNGPQGDAATATPTFSG